MAQQCLLGRQLASGPVLVLLAAVVASLRLRHALHRRVLTPHLTLRNAIFWSTIFFAFAGCEAGSLMGDEIRDAQRTLPRAMLLAGLIVALAYIAGTAAMLVALPGDAVSGLDGFMRGVGLLCDRLSLHWLSPIIAAAGGA